MTLPDLIDAYITAKIADGRAKRTIQDYRRVLGRFTEWHNGGDLDRTTVREYVAAMRQIETWSESTVALHIRYLRAFWRWIYEEGHTEENLAAAIAAPRIMSREEELITPEELRRLLAACEQGDYPARDKAFILMLVDTGLRRGEIMALERSQVNFEFDGDQVAGAYLLIAASKTHDKRWCFLGRASAKALHTYLEGRDDAYSELWVGEQGPWSYWAPAQMLERRAKDAGIDPAKVHPHAFRKVFATWWIERGGDEQSLMRLGGWSSPDMLRIYVRLAGRQALQRRHKQHSPVDRALEEEDE